MNKEGHPVQGADQRQSYRKPRLRRIELVAGEVLGQGCKMASTGQNFGNEHDCGLLSSCVGEGS